MARSASLGVLAVWLVACGDTKPPPVAMPAASSSTPSAALPSSSTTSSSSAPSSPEPDFDLAIGEAVELEGTPLPGPSNPTSGVIELRGLPAKKLIVVARGAGLATLHFTDPSGASQSKTFRITEIACRKAPLHPAVVLNRDDRAIIETANVRQVEALFHESPLVASANVDREGSRIRLFAQMDGHTTLLAMKHDGSYSLYDVFVGPACAERQYASIAPAIPPGSVGPKGDGTCQRVDGEKVTPAPCPDLTKIEKLPKESFSSLACEWLAACGRRGYEGCCVDCTKDFAMKLDRQCALKALRQKSCADVVKIADTKGCIH